LAGSVLFIVENLPLPFDRRVWMEATTLRAAGFDVAVICPKGKGFEAPYEYLEGVHIYRHDLAPEGNSLQGYAREYASALWGEWRLARRVWRTHGIDVVHICNPPDLLFLVAGWHKLLHKAHVIFDQHDLMPELYEAKFARRDMGYRLMKVMERLTYATANVVISTNESYRSVALTRGRKSTDDVFIVRSAPDLTRFRPTEPDPRYHTDGKYTVGYVGVMGPQEGLDYLLRAARIIVADRERTDVRFMLIGSGPSLPELKRLAADLGIADFVEFTGRVPDDELCRRLSSCDVCVNPDPKNPFNDCSTMNKILEYMALGRPVVQFDLTEGRRSAGEASVYAIPNDEHDLAESILRLLDDPQTRAAIGREGQRRMEEELEWRHQAPRLLEAYRQAMGG
jgi:glycosyltransferase involved in cell wall biosynthesis